MTDAEKIARMVSWMGGWPEHDTVKFGVLYCARCLCSVSDLRNECRNFNPFERIEDAFLVVERLRLLGHEYWIDLASTCNGYMAYTREGKSENVDPARAIAEAAFKVIAKLTNIEKVVK